MKDESLLRSTVVALSQRYGISEVRMYVLLRSRGEERALEYLEHRRNFYCSLLELEVSGERPMTHAQALACLENRGRRMDIDKERV